MNHKELLKILNYIKNNNIKRLEPSIDVNGGFSYPIIGQYSTEEQISFIETCLKNGIFYGKPSMSLLSCAYCESLYFSNNFTCTLCKSSNITRAIAIEHDTCGNIDFASNYMSIDGTLTCEKCNKQLKSIGVDYSRVGYFYKCLECKAMLSNIDQLYICLKCNRSSLNEELKIFQLFTYAINQQKLFEKLNDNNFMFFVVEELGRVGIESKQLGSIIGTSKIEHTFSLIVYDDKNNPFIVVDTIQFEEQNNNNNNRIENEDDNTQILSFIGKCLDTRVSNKIILAIPALKQNIRELININKITLVESKTKDDAKLDLTGVITDIYNKGETFT